MIQKKLSLEVIFDRKHLATSSTATNPVAGLIQLRCRYDGKYLYIAIASVYADQFGRKVKGKIVGDTVHGRPDAEEINDSITLLRRRVLEEYNRCQRIGVPFELGKIDPKGSTTDKRDFLGWMEERVKGNDRSASTKQSHLNVISVLRQFGKIATFDDLTKQKVDELDRWLIAKPNRRNGKPIGTSYRAIIHRLLHRHIKDAIYLDLIADDPYAKFEMPHGKGKDREFLTEKEVELIKNYQADDEYRPKYHKRYLLARDLFIIQCYTGLSYSDLMQTDWKSAKDEGIIRASRQKTNVEYAIKLLPPVIEVLDRYKWKMPSIRLETYDHRLHHIAEKVGIKKNLSSHIGRHTFATTFGLKMGIPLEVISKILGHSDISTTQIYAKVMESQVVDAFDTIAEKLK